MNIDKKESFSIRKLTIGVVSVMFGAVIFGVSANQVKADTNSTPATTQTTDNEAKTSTDQASPETTKTTDQTAANTNTDQTATTTTQTAPTTALDSTLKAQKVEASVAINGSNYADNNKVILVNRDSGDTATITITLKNDSKTDQSISKYVELPTFNGTNSAFKVASSVAQNGKIVFGGNYTAKGITLNNFDLATGAKTSTGFGNSEADAAKDATLIGGFGINGIIKAGDSVTIDIPVVLNWTGYEEQTKTSNFGFWSSNANGRVRIVRNFTTLKEQAGKRYFLVDASKSDTTHFYEVSQSVLNALAKAGLTPTYQSGDISFTNLYGIDNTLTNDENTPVYYSAYVDVTNAIKRLNSTLHQFGFTVSYLGQLTGFGAGNAYMVKHSYTYYDAQGKQVQLGQGNLGNFMIGVSPVISQVAGKTTVLNLNDKNYKSELESTFANTSNANYYKDLKLKVDTSAVNINKAGVYDVKVSTSDNSVSRIFKAVVVATQTPTAYAKGDKNHKDLAASSLLSDQSIKDLTDNGYTISWSQAPSYDKTGKVAAAVKLTDADNNSVIINGFVNVTTTPVTPVTPVNPSDNNNNNNNGGNSDIIAPVKPTVNPDDTNSNKKNNNDNSGKNIIAPVHPSVDPDHTANKTSKKGATSQNGLIKTSAKSENVASQNTLPQTGAAKDSLAIVGLLASVLALFGLAINPKKNN